MNTLNLVMLLEHATRKTPEKPLLLFNEEAWTYARVEAEARRHAAALHDLGVRPGDRVALLLPNEPEFALIYFGILKLGAVPVPLNITTPGPELGYFLNDSDAVALVAHSSVVAAASEGIPSAPVCRSMILVGPRPTEPPAAKGVWLADLVAQAPADFETALRRPEDEGVILYTAGTTGRPRGVILSQFNLFFSAQFTSRDFWQVGPTDVVPMVASGAHIFGQMLLNGACATFATLSLLPRFEPKAFFQLIQAHRITYFAGVPTLAHLMLQSPLAREFDLSSLRGAMFSGAPLHPDLARQFKSRFPVALTTGYGMTEGVPFTYMTAQEFEAAPAGTVGRPALGLSLRIVDEQDRPVAGRELGEIAVRGPQVFQGYLKQPEETRHAMRGGWFHTGDTGWQDEAGYVFLVDRLKDMIKRGGYAVAPAEVERVLMIHPAVADAAVIGVSDPVRGEEIKAFVVLRPAASASADDLIAHCRAQLAAYKYPRLIEFRESLPKSPAGKTLRRLLRPEH
jgi:long-chain acyl-CoA synthetase